MVILGVLVHLHQFWDSISQQLRVSNLIQIGDISVPNRVPSILGSHPAHDLISDELLTTLGQSLPTPSRRLNLPTLWGDFSLNRHRDSPHHVVVPRLCPLAVELVFRDYPHGLRWVRDVGVSDVDHERAVFFGDVEDDRGMAPVSLLRVPGDHHRGSCIRPFLECLDRARRHKGRSGTEVLSRSESLFPACALHWTRTHDAVHFIFIGLNTKGFQAHRQACRHASVLRPLPDWQHFGLRCFVFCHGGFYLSGPFKTDKPTSCARYRADTAH